MLFLALFYEFLRFSNYKISITLLIFKMLQIADSESFRKFKQFFSLNTFSFSNIWI